MSSVFTPAQNAFRFLVDGSETGACCVAKDGIGRYLPVPDDGGAHTGNYATTPSATANRITGAITIIVLHAPDAPTRATNQHLVSKWYGDTNNRCYSLYIDATTGSLTFAWSTTGANTNAVSITTAPGYAAGVPHWIRFDFDPATGNYEAFKAPITPTSLAVPTSWTSLGSNSFGATTIFDSTTAAVRIKLTEATPTTSSHYSGHIYRVQIRSGIMGTVAVEYYPNADATDGATSFVSNTGETWTMAGLGWLAAINTNITLPIYGTRTIRCKVRIQETGGKAGSSNSFQFQFNKNSTGQTSITTTSNNLRAVDSPTMTGAGATTNKLGAGTGSFVAGKVSETGAAVMTLTASNFTELDFVISLRAVDLAAADAMVLRTLVDLATMPYNQTPTVTAGTVTLMAQAYTMTATQQSFSLTGQSTALKADRRMTADQSTFTLTGQNVALPRGHSLPLVQASFTLTGQATALRAARRLAFVNGAFTLSGQTTALKYGRAFAPGVGTFTLTGEGASLRAGRRVAPVNASFTLSGQATALRAAHAIAPTAATFTLSGQATALRTARQLALANGSFALSGQNATPRAARQIALGLGSFALTGEDATLRADRQLAAAVSSFTLSGQDLALRTARQLAADPGSFAVAGQDPVLRAARRLGLGAGLFALAGEDVVLTTASNSLSLALAMGAFTLSGQTAAFRRGLRFAAGPGAFALTAGELFFAIVQYSMLIDAFPALEGIIDGNVLYGGVLDGGPVLEGLSLTAERGD